MCSVFDKLDLFKYYFNYLNVYSVLWSCWYFKYYFKNNYFNMCSVFENKVYLKYIYIILMII